MADVFVAAENRQAMRWGRRHGIACGPTAHNLRRQTIAGNSDAFAHVRSNILHTALTAAAFLA